MKKALYILIFCVVCLGVYGFVDAIKDAKNNTEYKETIKDYKKRTLYIAKKRDSLELIVNDLRDSISRGEEEVVELEKSQEMSYKQAQEWRREYLKLKDRQPVTIEDSLEVSQEMVNVLVEENSSLDESLTVCDSVKVIQREVISDLKEVISTKDLIIANRENMIKVQDEEIEFLKMEVKEQRRGKFKSFLKGMGTGGLIIGILILI